MHFFESFYYDDYHSSYKNIYMLKNLKISITNEEFQITKNQSTLKFNELYRFKRCIFIPFYQMKTITSKIPLFPLFLKLLMFFSNIMLVEFSRRHVWMKISISLTIRKDLNNFYVNLLELFTFLSLRVEEDSTMREEIHFP